MSETSEGPPETKESRQQKRWSLALILVCFGAVAGGAGTVVLQSSDAETGSRAGTPGGAQIRVRCDRMVEPKVFNPRSTRGSKFAKVAFRFEYRTDARFRVAAARQVVENWDLMIDKVLVTLKRRTAYELNSDVGLSALAEDLRNDVEDTLFRADGTSTPIAVVDRILWSQVLVQ